MQKLVVTQELKNAVKEVLRLRKYITAITPQIESIKQGIIDSYEYVIAEEFKEMGEDGRITNPDRAYLMDDEQAKDYYTKCNIEYNKAGYNVAYGFCPLLTAENDEREALRAMVNESKYLCDVLVVPADFWEMIQYKLPVLRKYHDIVIKMVTNTVDKKELEPA